MTRFDIALSRAAAVSVVAALALLASPPSAAADPSVVEANIQAHPALWTLHIDNATAYFLGSIHLLPPNVIWHTPAIDAAMAAADTFVFEVPIDAAGTAAISDFVKQHGRLPDGTTLPSLLPDGARDDYQKVLALTHVPPASVDGMRPWLAAIVLETVYMQEQHYSPNSGLDRQVFMLAAARGKSLRYFETVDQQMAMLMPTDRKVEIAEFDATLKEFQVQSADIGPLVDAWAHGDAGLVGKLMNEEFDKEPGVKKALIDDRNDAWVAQLNKMLGEHHTYFITVGTGHLVGPHGVPALLRKEGYRVDGP